jgi:AcrR family transcriptional regulator
MQRPNGFGHPVSGLIVTMGSTLTKEQVEENGTRGRGRPRCEVARKRILEAALESLDEVGFANTTTDLIAERAGASKATIYRWWPTKAALLLEALRDIVTQELPFPDTGDLKEDVRQQLRNFIKLLTGRRGGVLRSFVAAAQSDAGVAAAFRNVWVIPRRAEAKTVLEKHQGAGRLPAEVDLELLLDVLYGPLYYRLLAGLGGLSPAYADEVTELTLTGLV